MKFVKNQMDEWRPDVVLSFMTKSNIIALLAGTVTNRKVPVVIAERANPYNAAKVFRVIRRYLYPLAKGCVFQTKDAQSYYKNILKCESIILKNPLNPDFNIEPYKGERKKKIVTVGRLSVEKNQKMLIDAFAKIAFDYPEYTLEIYGEGPLRPELEERIRKYSLQNRVFLMGRKEQVQQHIKDAEIFVLPSNSEGMPNALLEAMALGLACIATDCPIGGSAVVIDNRKNGMLVPMNNVEIMAQSLMSLMSDSTLTEELQKNAVKIVEDFESKKVCAQWEDYLCSIAHTKKNSNLLNSN